MNLYQVTKEDESGIHICRQLDLDLPIFGVLGAYIQMSESFYLFTCSMAI